MPHSPFRLLASATLVAALVVRADAQQPQIRAFNLADIDTTCKPCENFYRFAAGGWQKNTPIPAAFSVWSSFDELTQKNYEVVRGILEAAARDAKTTRDADRARLGRFYASCMDSASVEAKGADPLRADLTRIASIRTADDVRQEIVRGHAAGIPLAFGSSVQQDAKDSRREIFVASQGGLGLPDRTYYFKTDSATKEVRDAYRTYVATLLRLTGSSTSTAQREADAVLALETALADASLDRLQLRDPANRYHLMSVAAIDSIAPALAWRRSLTALDLARVDSFNVAQPEFFRRLSREIATRSVDDWKAYLRVHRANAAASRLSSAFVNAEFAFNAKLTGARELEPRWRRCLAVSDRLLSDALGKEYVKVAFTPEAKTTMDAMVDNLMIVYERRLKTLPWMSEATRAQALAKLGTFKRKIGYPERWKSYDGLIVDPAEWFTNHQRAATFAVRRSRAKVGKPVDRGEWTMTPPTVNAYYSAANNEIGFPAGRMQPPFFHPSFDLGANYGGIGATIGHEVSHGFDDQGRKYDAVGNLRDWWSPDDAARFGDLAARMDAQYSAYTVLDGLHLNGKQTMGENIADNAGVSIAYEALQLALAGKPRTLIDGFTPEQRFFLGWAQARRQTWRDQALRLTIATGVHSPGEFRVNGPLSNMPEFAAAFGCKPGDAMVRDATSRVRIW